MRSEQDVLRELKDLCIQDGYLNTIAYFCYLSGFIFYDNELKSEDLAKTYSKNNLISIEIRTILGFAIKNGINLNKTSSHQIQNQIDKTNILLNELHEIMKFDVSKELFSYSNNRITSPISSLRDFPNSFFREIIFYGGMSAYNFQFECIAKDKYSRDYNWIADNIGISIDDCAKLCNKVQNLITNNLNKAFNDKNSIINIINDDNFLVNLFKFSLNNLVAESQLCKATVIKFLSLFSVGICEKNSDFNELHDFNIIQAKPILSIGNDEYISFDSSFIYQSLYESPNYWFLQDKTYRDIASKNKGKFAEEFIYNQLVKIFGNKNIVMNVNIFSSPSNCLGEIDVFVQHADKIIIIQTKSKGLTLNAQKCNDDSLKDDFKKAVQDAYDQGLICANALLGHNNYMQDSEGNPVFINKKINEIFILCITSSHYPALSVQSAHFLEYETNSYIYPPYVTDIFFLDALCEFLDSPLYLMSYLKRRLNYINKIRANHELTILGYHLAHNLYFEKEFGLVAIDDVIAQNMDAAFLSRRTNIQGNKTPEGILTKYKENIFEIIINQIKYSEDSSTIKVGETLLELSEETIFEMIKHIKTMSKDTKDTNKHHDYTILNESFGLTIHCNKNKKHEAVEKLRTHCENRKYKQKIQNYYGVCIDDNYNIKSCIALEYPYFDSPEMNMRTYALKDLEDISPNKVIKKNINKIGRNDSCPCGSGLKFKKCCLNK